MGDFNPNVLTLFRGGGSTKLLLRGEAEVNLPQPRISGCISGNNTKFGREVPLNVHV